MRLTISLVFLTYCCCCSSSSINSDWRALKTKRTSWWPMPISNIILGYEVYLGLRHTDRYTPPRYPPPSPRPPPLIARPCEQRATHLHVNHRVAAVRKWYISTDKILHNEPATILPTSTTTYILLPIFVFPLGWPQTIQEGKIVFFPRNFPEFSKSFQGKKTVFQEVCPKLPQSWGMRGGGSLHRPLRKRSKQHTHLQHSEAMAGTRIMLLLLLLQFGLVIAFRSYAPLNPLSELHLLHFFGTIFGTRLARNTINNTRKRGEILLK